MRGSHSFNIKGVVLATPFYFDIDQIIIIDTPIILLTMILACIILIINIFFVVTQSVLTTIGFPVVFNLVRNK